MTLTAVYQTEQQALSTSLVIIKLIQQLDNDRTGGKRLLLSPDSVVDIKNVCDKLCPVTLPIVIR